MRLVITGGHHSSAIPVILELKKNHPDTEIIWIGHKYSLAGDKNETLEYKEITGMGIEFIELKTGKFYKNANIKSMSKIFSGLMTAKNILSNKKPDVVLSFGGYIAVPVVIAAWLQNIPTLTHEQTLVVGYANKVISLFAKRVMISFEESAKFFNPNKVVFTGIPLRQSITEVRSTNFVTDNDLPYIYVTGGKSGSHIINEVLGDSLDILLTKFNVIHQCGDYSVEKDYDKLNSIYTQIQNNVPGKYFLRKFVLEDEIGEAFNKASIVVSRSGAHIISELAYLNKPSILIPIPWVSHNEQNLNAQYLKNKGLAEIIQEKYLTPKNLVELLQEMRGTLEGYQLIGNVPAFKQNAAFLITDEIFKVLSRK
jgi:UDP-N-acetylglucosamine--N-acetylmuramyl-(pentapeptide) pyrophosphoryl-undecaprenol N-acetylglucosamine transferase